MTLIQFIDLAGIVAFSIAGAFAAMEKKLDVFGVFIIAFVTALGGGTIRDVIIGEVPVRWMYDVQQGGVVLLSAAAALLFTNVLRNFRKTLLLFDSIGLAFFTVIGIQKGLHLALHPVICIALGTITACFGGVLRDISLNEIPLIFRREFYATACIAGGIVYFLLRNMEVPQVPLEAVCITTIALLRLLAIRYNWQLPVRKQADTQ